MYLMFNDLLSTQASNKYGRADSTHIIIPYSRVEESGQKQQWSNNHYLTHCMFLKYEWVSYQYRQNEKSQ